MACRLMYYKDHLTKLLNNEANLPAVFCDDIFKSSDLVPSKVYSLLIELCAGMLTLFLHPSCGLCCFRPHAINCPSTFFTLFHNPTFRLVLKLKVKYDLGGYEVLLINSNSEDAC